MNTTELCRAIKPFVLSWIAEGAPGGPSVERLENPGFETGVLTPWELLNDDINTAQVVSVDTWPLEIATSPNSGTYCCALGQSDNYLGAGTLPALRAGPFFVRANDLVRLSFWYKFESAQPGSLSYEIRFTRLDGSVPTYTWAARGATEDRTDWTFQDRSFRVDPGGWYANGAKAWLTFGVQLDPLDGRATPVFRYVYLDDIRFWSDRCYFYGGPS